MALWLLNYNKWRLNEKFLKFYEVFVYFKLWDLDYMLIKFIFEVIVLQK